MDIYACVFDAIMHTIPSFFHDLYFISNTLPLIAILTCILTFVALVTTIFSLLRSQAGRYLVLLCFCVMIWSLGYSFTIAAKTDDVARLWALVSTAGLGFFPTFCYFYSESFLGTIKIRWKIKALFIGMGLIFEGFNFFSSTMIIGTYHYWWGYFPRYGYTFLIFLVYFSLVAILILSKTWKRFRSLPAGTKKTQTRIILVAWIISFSGSSDFLIGFGVPLIPVSPIQVTLFVIIAFLLLYRYGLLGLLQYMSLESILHSTSDSILILDSSGSIQAIDFRTCKLLGYNGPEDLVGKPPNILFAPDSPLLTEERIHHLSVTGKLSTLGLQLQSRHGDKIHVRVNLSGMFNRKEEMLGIIAIARDIRDELHKEQVLRSINQILQQKIQEVEERTNELAKTNEQLEQSRTAMLQVLEDKEDSHRRLEEAYKRLEELDEMKDAFLSSVSHELRTPLTSIRSFSEILINYPNEGESTKKEFLEIIKNESERLTRLVNDLLDLSKIKAGKMSWNEELIHIEHIIEASLDTLAIMAREKNQHLSAEIEKNLYPVYVDRDRIYQVIANLVNNAIKFTPPHGTILVKAEKIRGKRASDQSNNLIRISITDTGIGIPRQEITTIFEKFKQGGDTIKEKPSGTGLGLAICKEIVLHYGGSIWVESEVGKGSTFSFTIPVTLSLGTTSPESGPLEAKDPGLDKPEIIVPQGPLPRLRSIDAE